MQHADESRMVTVKAVIVNETDGAILVKRDREARYPEWVPLSEITMNSRSVFNDAEITLPAWLAKKAGL